MCAKVYTQWTMPPRILSGVDNPSLPLGLALKRRIVAHDLIFDRQYNLAK
jgi:hypothetical protein